MDSDGNVLARHRLPRFTVFPWREYWEWWLLRVKVRFREREDRNVLVLLSPSVMFPNQWSTDNCQPQHHLPVHHSWFYDLFCILWLISCFMLTAKSLSLSYPICSRIQLKCDGTRWRTGGQLKEKLANGLGSQYPSHYLGTRCIQHYYRWCTHLGCQ